MSRQPDEAAQKALKRGDEILADRVATDLGAKIKHVRRHESLNPLIFPVYELRHIKPQQLLDLDGYHRLHDIAEEKNVKIAAERTGGIISIIFDVTKPYGESPDAQAVAQRTAAPLKKRASELKDDLARLQKFPQMNPLVYPVSGEEQASPQDVRNNPAWQRMEAIAREANVKIEARKKHGRIVAIVIDATRTYGDLTDKPLAARAAKPRTLNQQAGTMEVDIARARKHPQLNPVTYDITAPAKISPQAMTGAPAYQRMHDIASALNAKIETQKKFRRGVTAITVDVTRPYRESPDAKAIHDLREEEKLIARRERRASQPVYEEAAAELAAEFAGSAQDQRAQEQREKEAEAQDKLALQQTDLQMRIFVRDQLPAVMDDPEKEFIYLPVEGATPREVRELRAYQDLHALCKERDVRVDVRLNAEGAVAITLLLKEPYSATAERDIPAPVSREQLAAEKDQQLQSFAKNNLPDVIRQADADGMEGTFTITVRELTPAELRRSQAYQALHHACAKLDRRIELGMDDGITTLFISLNEPYTASTHAGKFTFPTYAEERAAKDAELQGLAQNHLPSAVEQAAPRR